MPTFTASVPERYVLEGGRSADAAVLAGTRCVRDAPAANEPICSFLKSQAPLEAPAMTDRTDKTSKGRDVPMLCAKMARRRSERDIIFVLEFRKLKVPAGGPGGCSQTLPQPGLGCSNARHGHLCTAEITMKKRTGAHQREGYDLFRRILRREDALCRRRVATESVWPVFAACINAALPSPSTASTLALCVPASAFTVSVRPPSAACTNAVLPGRRGFPRRDT